MDAVPVAEAQKRAPADIKAVAAFLRSKSGPRNRKGVLNGKRVDYFKGKSAVKALLSPAFKKVKGVPRVEVEEDAKQLMSRMLPHAFFLRTERPEMAAPPATGQPRPLQMSPQQSFDSLAYYTWFVESSPLSTMLGAAALVLVILAGCLFPLWPPFMRLGVWYLSLGVMGLIGLFFGIAIVRLILWVITSLVMKRGIWWFPNLFEDVSVIDSFIPFWAWDEPPPSKKRHASKHSKGSKKGSSSKAASTTEPSSGLAAPVLASSPQGPEFSAARASAVDIGGSSSSTAAEGGPAQKRQPQQAYVEDVTED